MMRILLTGASGFLGRQLVEELKPQFDLVTLGRSKDNHIVCDLAAEAPKRSGSPDYVVHAAGLAHTRPSTQSAQNEFFRVNLRATDNLLDSLLHGTTLPQAFLYISTVAVYGLMKGEEIAEDHPLQATDPYGKSKIEAEMLLRQWCEQHRVPLTIFRLPLVAGACPPGNLAAMIEGIQKGRYLTIAGGKARKSMVMASDVAKIIPQALNFPGIYHLTDGYHPSFFELEGVISSQLGVKRPHALPHFLTGVVGLGGDFLETIAHGKSPITSERIEKITSTLTFTDQKARLVLGWNPHRVIDVFRIS